MPTCNPTYKTYSSRQKTTSYFITHAHYSPRTQKNLTQLGLLIDNTTLPMTTRSKILGLTLDPKLTYKRHIDLTATKARNTINILKVLTSTKWGKHTKTILATYKAITRPVLEYASTIWCCCLPTPMTLASGGSPMFPLVVHQPASPSLRRGLSTNPGTTMWSVCGCS